VDTDVTLLEVEDDKEDVLLDDVLDDEDNDEEIEIEEELVADTKLDDAVEIELDDVIRVSVGEVKKEVLKLVVLIVNRSPPGGAKKGIPPLDPDPIIELARTVTVIMMIIAIIVARLV
jgi:hypothetical protein